MQYDTETGAPIRVSRQHYYGDVARILFVMAAIVILVAETTGADIPLTAGEAVIWAVILAISAGITNPEQSWIHWINEGIAILGVLVFGTSAIAHYRAGAGLLDSSYLYNEILALLSVITVYYTTKTIRGNVLRPHLK